VPELPEVESWRRLAERVAVGRRVTSVWAAEDAKVFDRNRRSDFQSLVGRCVKAAHRKGKHLWLAFDRPPHLYLHFAMTGALENYPGEADRPRFLKLELALDSGRRLGFTEIRRFGKARLLEDPAAVPPIALLGFDAWLELPPAAEFARRLRARRAPVKAVLLDQSFAAGVGNWIADEMLYQAGIDPRRPADGLTEAEARALRTALRRILARAVQHDAFTVEFPRDWLFHVRWGKARDARTRDGHAVAFCTVGGRTTAWVPTVQR
jgi:formamidopyrimidine-DNA glycosylase